MTDKGRPLPKFGEWDVNDPTSAEGFTVIFNKARDEKKTGGKPDSPGKVDAQGRSGADPAKAPPKKWLCCIQSLFDFIYLVRHFMFMKHEFPSFVYL
ncbi:uncharacterized protein LOC111474733 isoform X1 [Cucurbita maxima]|uniref:Uncharacterized protein LOC111474733 isoform X1 n=1 Tax=Cucurbita maxima TaxID=3661 RepID=A0A6J1IGN4_CUCMA|nr:uncharacterized protein LOC111474733 isoform X1 [Cucurbita maxima]